MEMEMGEGTGDRRQGICSLASPCFSALLRRVHGSWSNPSELSLFVRFQDDNNVS